MKLPRDDIEPYNWILSENETSRFERRSQGMNRVRKSLRPISKQDSSNLEISSLDFTWILVLILDLSSKLLLKEPFFQYLPDWLLFIPRKLHCRTTLKSSFHGKCLLVELANNFSNSFDCLLLRKLEIPCSSWIPGKVLWLKLWHQTMAGLTFILPDI